MNLTHELYGLSYTQFLKQEQDRKQTEELLFELRLYNYGDLFRKVVLRDKGCCFSCKVQVELNPHDRCPQQAQLYCVSRLLDKPRLDRYRLACYSCSLLEPSKPIPYAHKCGKNYVDRILRRDQKLNCYFCNILTITDPKRKRHHDAATADHLIPKSKGGTNRLSNLVLACHSCNSAKMDMSEEEFKNSLYLQRRIALVPKLNT